ncbi:MAG: fumarylacetoacetate hydrolase family protein [Actinomycetota bacterium]
MRFAALNHRAHVLIGDRAIDLEEASGGRLSADPMETIRRLQEVRSFIEETQPVGRIFRMEELTLPVPAPPQSMAIGVNYADHAAEMDIELAAEPVTFAKFPTSLAGPNELVTLPSSTVDWEIELVLVMGRDAFRLSIDEAWDAVAGLTIGQDLSDRVVQFAAGRQFSLGKSSPGFGPIGPWIVTPDELPNRDDLELSCAIDGVTVQHSRTSKMLRGVAPLLVDVTKHLALKCGDVLFTGTPAGAGFALTPPRYLKPGEQLTSTIEGIGTLVTTFAAP